MKMTNVKKATVYSDPPFILIWGTAATEIKIRRVKFVSFFIISRLIAQTQAEVTDVRLKKKTET